VSTSAVTVKVLYFNFCVPKSNTDLSQGVRGQRGAGRDGQGVGTRREGVRE